jgi:hypothetical protein
LLPKGGDLSLCKNWRTICLLDVSSKILSALMTKRAQKVLDIHGLESQSGFRPHRGTSDGIFSALLTLQKRKEHNCESWALFVDLVKAFDSVSREALFMILRRFGLPDHFVNILIRLHSGSVMKFKMGEIQRSIECNCGVRQGSVEGPILFSFVMQAVMETMVWPDECTDIEFMTCYDETGMLHGGRVSKIRNIDKFLVRAFLYADDLAIIFSSRDELVKVAKVLYDHLRKFGLTMHTGVGGAESKTKAMYFPGPSQEYSDGDVSVISLGGDKTITFTEEMIYLGSVIVPSLRSDNDVGRRIMLARRAMGILRPSFRRSDLALRVKGKMYVALVLSILMYGSECWTMTEELMKELRTFHNSNVRSMCKVNMSNTQKHHISSSTLYKRLNIQPIDCYFHRRILRWAGHVSRMPLHRLPRKLLTSWSTDSRLAQRSQMSWGLSFENILTTLGIPVKFCEWKKLAADRPKWRELVIEVTGGAVG